jgi:hypothetical protein
MQTGTCGSTIVVQSEDQVSSDLAGEVVILHLPSGGYYGLDAVGARIWDLIRVPKTINEVRDALTEEYDVEVESCERDLLELLQELERAGLVETCLEMAQ